VTSKNPQSVCLPYQNHRSGPSQQEKQCEMPELFKRKVSIAALPFKLALDHL